MPRRVESTREFDTPDKTEWAHPRSAVPTYVVDRVSYGPRMNRMRARRGGRDRREDAGGLLSRPNNRTSMETGVVLASFHWPAVRTARLISYLSDLTPRRLRMPHLGPRTESSNLVILFNIDYKILHLIFDIKPDNESRIKIKFSQMETPLVLNNKRPADRDFYCDSHTFKFDATQIEVALKK